MTAERGRGRLGPHGHQARRPRRRGHDRGRRRRPRRRRHGRVRRARRRGRPDPGALARCEPPPRPPPPSTTSSSRTTAPSASPAARRPRVGIARALQEATVGLALETVGTCDALFQMVLAYVKDRKQFGVPIGSFQAIKHKMSNMFLAIERARALCYFAVAAINEDTPDRATAVSMAKAAATTASAWSAANRSSPSAASASPGSTTATSSSRGPRPMVRSSAARPRIPSPSPAPWASAPTEARQTGAVRPGESLIAALDLAPHPEGGWYRRTWVADGRGRRTARRQRHLLPPPGGRGLGAAPGGRHRAVALLRRRPARAAPRVARRAQRRAGARARRRRPVRRPRSWSTPVSGSRRARSGATPSSGRR